MKPTAVDQMLNNDFVVTDEEDFVVSSTEITLILAFFLWFIDVPIWSHCISMFVSEIVERITEREKEIEDLLKKVLEEEEKKKKEEEERKKKEEEAAKAQQEVTDDIIECADAPQSESAPPSAEPKKKRGNLFQRMVNALRKRFGNQRSSRAQGW